MYEEYHRGYKTVRGIEVLEKISPGSFKVRCHCGKEFDCFTTTIEQLYSCGCIKVLKKKISFKSRNNQKRATLSLYREEARIVMNSINEIEMFVKNENDTRITSPIFRGSKNIVLILDGVILTKESCELILKDKQRLLDYALYKDLKKKSK